MILKFIDSENMPPKKKKGSPKKSKKGKKSDDPNAIDELSKQLFLVQIRDLDQKVNRRLEKSELLEKSNAELVRKIGENNQEKMQSTSVLRKELELKSDEAHGLFQELQSLTLSKQEHQEKANAELTYAREKNLISIAI